MQQYYFSLHQFQANKMDFLYIVLRLTYTRGLILELKIESPCCVSFCVGSFFCVMVLGILSSIETYIRFRTVLSCRKTCLV